MEDELKRVLVELKEMAKPALSRRFQALADCLATDSAWLDRELAEAIVYASRRLLLLEYLRVLMEEQIDGRATSYSHKPGAAGAAG